jgi:hypothetical protein
VTTELRRFIDDHLIPEIPPAPTELGIHSQRKRLADWKILEDFARRPMRSKTRRKTTAEEDVAVLTWKLAKETAEGADLALASARAKLVEAMGEDYGWEGSWGALLHTRTAAREIPQKQAAYDDIVDAIANDTSPTAERIRSIIAARKRTSYPGAKLLPRWLKEAPTQDD